MTEQAPVAQVAPDGDVSATDEGSVFFFSCSKRIWAEMLMWQVVVIIIIINNCIAKWRLSASDIQELSPLAASS